jgi:hypothetical protein
VRTVLQFQRDVKRENGSIVRQLWLRIPIGRFLDFPGEGSSAGNRRKKFELTRGRSYPNFAASALRTGCSIAASVQNGRLFD